MGEPQKKTISRRRYILIFLAVLLILLGTYWLAYTVYEPNLEDGPSGRANEKLGFLLSLMPCALILYVGWSLWELRNYK
jgi:hypothetical protein